MKEIKNDAKEEKTKKKGIWISLIVLAIIAFVVSLTIVFTKIERKNQNINNEEDVGYISSISKDDIVKLKNNTCEIVSTELLVTFKENTSNEEAKKVIEKYDGEIVGELYFLNQYQVRFKESGEEFLKNKKEEFKSEKKVKSVIYNYVNESEIDYNKVGSAIVEEIHFDKDYHMSELGINTAYEAVEGKEKINVGIIDSPIYYTHEDLDIDKNNIHFIASSDFETIDDVLSYYSNYDHEGDKENKKQYHEFGGGCDYIGFRSHGTHVAGIIAAKHNGIGINGVNDNVNLYYASPWYSFKDDNFDGRFKNIGTTFSHAYALSSLIMSNCKVINMSIAINDYDEKGKIRSISDDNEIYLEYKEYFNDFFDKVKDTNKDFLIVKSAGNNSTNVEDDVIKKVFKENEFANEHMIVVGSVKRPWTIETDDVIPSFKYQRASYSNYGEYVDIFATGTIYSTIYDNDYYWMEGTSQATPIVSGIASLVYEANPNLVAKQVKEILINSANDYISCDERPVGVVDAENAVNAAKEFNGEIKKQELSKIGLIKGTVKNSNNEIVNDNVYIYFTNTETNETTYTQIEMGNYECFLPNGTYNIKAKMDGYLKFEKNGVKIDNSEPIICNIVLSDNSLANLNPKKEIIGTWKAIGTNNNLYSISWLYGSAFSLANELTFKEDGTYELGIGVIYWQEGNYEIQGDIIKLTNTQYKGDNPDKKIAEKFIINNGNDKKHIILEEKTEDNTSVNVIFVNAEDTSDNDSIMNSNKNTDTNSSTTGKIKIGNYSLEYGKYKSNLDPSANASGTFILNTNNTCSYKGIALQGGGNDWDVTGTFKITKEDLYGYGNMSDCIEFTFSNGQQYSFEVYKNNEFSSDWIGFVYSGN